MTFCPTRWRSLIDTCYALCYTESIIHIRRSKMKLYVDTGKPECDRMITSALSDSSFTSEGLAICADYKAIPSDAVYTVVIYTDEDYLSSPLHDTLKEKFGKSFCAVKYPISIPELKRAVREVMSAESLPRDGFSFDKAARTVTKNGTTVALSEKEAELFGELLTSRGLPLSREELRCRLWQNTDGTNAPDVYISYLRRKLTPLLGDGFIVNVRGAGYMLRE